MEEYDFGDLTPKEQLITISGKKYILREASAEAALAYRGQLMKGARMEEGKISFSSGLSDGEPLLVSHCLYFMNEKTGQIDATKGGQPWNVPLTTVKLWPVRVMKGLFNRIKEMSPSLVDEPETVFDIEKAIAKLQEKLTKLKEGKDDPKGEPSGTTGSSA